MTKGALVPFGCYGRQRVHNKETVRPFGPMC